MENWSKIIQLCQTEKFVAELVNPDCSSAKKQKSSTNWNNSYSQESRRIRKKFSAEFAQQNLQFRTEDDQTLYVTQKQGIIGTASMQDQTRNPQTFSNR